MDYLDLIVRPKDLDEFLAGLLRFLDSPQVGEWQALDLYNLIDTSPTLAGLERATADVGWGCLSEKLQHSPYIPLPGDWETYLAGIDKKQRHEIRRKIRRAEESGEVRWYITRDPAQLEGDIQAFVAMMRTDPEKAAFFARSDTMLDTMVAITRCAFEHDCLVLAFLEITGEKAAVTCVSIISTASGFTTPGSIAVNWNFLGVGAVGLPAAVGQRAETQRSLTSCGGTKTINTVLAPWTFVMRATVTRN